MNPGTPKIAHLAAKVTAEIMFPDPDMPHQQRHDVLAHIVTGAHPLGVMLGVVATAGASIAYQTPTVDVLAVAAGLVEPVEDKLGFDLGVGLAYRAMAQDSPDPVGAAVRFFADMLEGTQRSPEEVTQVAAVAVGVTLSIYRKHASPW